LLAANKERKQVGRCRQGEDFVQSKFSDIGRFVFNFLATFHSLSVFFINKTKLKPQILIFVLITTWRSCRWLGMVMKRMEDGGL
jgi:hypothetical protein